MAKLKPGAIMVDLVGGGIYGDGGCPEVDLIESAEALLSLLPHVQHKGLWGLSKAFDEDCYIYTANKTFKVPADLPLPDKDIYRGPGTGLGPSRRNTTVTAMTYLPSSRLGYFDHNWYSVLVGSVKDGHACEETEGIEDMGKPARDRHEHWKAQIEANKPDKQLTFC